MENIEQYFEGERFQCYIGIIVSAICLGLAIYFFKQQNPLLKGISYSFFPLSFILLCICSLIVIRTPKDIERVLNFKHSAPHKMKGEELPRIEKVMKTFEVLKKIEIAVFLAGIGLMIIFWNNNLGRGIAIGITIETLMLFIFDTIAEARGKIYLEYLQAF